jgi:hypothetical protein
MRKTCFMIFVIAGIMFLGCIKNQDNPFKNPDNAQIINTRISSSDSTVYMHSEYSCTVNVFLPEFIDTLAAVICYEDFCDTLSIIDSIDSEASNAVFRFELQAAGLCTLHVEIVRTNGTRDTEIIVLAVEDLSPVAAAELPSCEAYLGTDKTVRFFITDPDSNLWLVSAGVDTADASLNDTVFSPFDRVKSHTMVRTFGQNQMLTALDLGGKLICYCLAVDFDSLISSVAECTISVADTTAPNLMLLPPYENDDMVIASLPIVITVIVTDNWGVDSVKFGANDMVLIGDTAGVEVSSLDSGKNEYEITAWDRAGNVRSIVFNLTYSGLPAYPPKIKELDMTITEGQTFPSVLLDTCIIITDPSVMSPDAYAQSLIWEVSDTEGNAWPYFDAAARICAIPVPDDSTIPALEWSGSIKLTFKATALNGLSDTRNALFSVTAVPDRPEIVLEKKSAIKGRFDTLWVDTCANDPDDDESKLNWEFKRGKYYMADSVFGSMLVKTKTETAIPGLDPLPMFRWSRRICIVPVDTSITLPTYVSDTLLFNVTDPGGLTASKKVIFSSGTNMYTK